MPIRRYRQLDVFADRPGAGNPLAVVLDAEGLDDAAMQAIARWTRSSSEEVRWRATWSLFRPRDPAAVPRLITLATDRSPLVRSWAVRGLGRPQADSANAGDAAEKQLLIAVGDPDRRVRTEAVRALGIDGVVVGRAWLDGTLNLGE